MANFPPAGKCRMTNCLWCVTCSLTNDPGRSRIPPSVITMTSALGDAKCHNAIIPRPTPHEKERIYTDGIKMDICKKPRGVLPNKEVGGGLGSHTKFGGKIWGKVRPSSPNKRKNLGSSVTTRRKSWEKVPILGSYLKFRGQNLGYLLFIFLEAKFWAPTSRFKGKIWGQAPRPPNMEVPPWGKKNTMPQILV